ncbi:MAG: hypothetical protein N3A65_04820, partial [candidate division WOR-3 bacterium]|nr:hypothetical protein [candidate division WOR-3 bacterium]
RTDCDAGTKLRNGTELFEKSLGNFQILDFAYWIWITLSVLTNFNEAVDFMNRHELKNIIPQKGLLKQKTFPLTFTMLYRKYLKCDEVDLY